MLIRFVSSSSAAIVVTAGLLLLMTGFIAQQERPTLTLRRIDYAPFVFEPRPVEVITRTRPPEPDRPDQPPPRPASGGPDTGIPVLDPTPRTPTPPARFGEPGLGIADGDLLPIVTIAPNYPPSAEQRGLEGYVVVSFTVNANGTVDDPRVIESTHAVFERAAIEAVAKFRFRPRVIGGRPVAVDDVRRRITFRLEN